MAAVYLWGEEGGQSHADHRTCAETMGGHRWVMHAMQVQAWLSSMPCDGAAASTSGQAEVGVCSGGKRVCVEMHKSTGLEKKKKKKVDLSIRSPTKRPTSTGTA